MTPLECFAANLRRARREKGLTQEALGFLAGLHRTEISLLERSGREPRLRTLLKLADALEIDLETLRSGIRWVPEMSRFETPARRSCRLP
jgi:transcriptional regulator with XRE-family HTH domain